MFLSFFVFSYLSYSCIAIDRIWLLRHCDKPKDNQNPCCNQLGYFRANQWHTYFERYFDSKTIIKIYTSGFYNENKNNLCEIAINKYPENKKCKKSRRMWLTANIINNTLSKKYNLKGKINDDYCSGDYKKIIKNIKENKKKYTDSIIVWQHHEIIDIIKHYDIKIDKWINKNIYDILFMIDVTQKKLYYDFYVIDNKTDNHLDNIDSINKWLKDFDRIPIYYSQKNILFNTENRLYYYYKDNIYVYYFIVFLLIIFVFVIFIFIVYLFFCHPYKKIDNIKNKNGKNKKNLNDSFEYSYLLDKELFNERQNYLIEIK